MMLLHLLKKDILIVKKYVLIMMIAAIAIPLVIFQKLPDYAGVLGFILSAIYAVFILLQYVSLKEYQSPRAATLLCATPFSRKMMVLSKYAFCMAVYVMCCVLYGIEICVVPGLGTLDIKLFILVFFLTSVFIGVYLPVQYKLGYEKTKFALTILIIASPYVFSLLLKMGNLNLDFLSTFSPFLVYGGIVVLGFMILAISIFLSMRFYDNTDLA